MADLTANPPKGVLSATRAAAPTWGSLTGAARARAAEPPVQAAVEAPPEPEFRHDPVAALRAEPRPTGRPAVVPRPAASLRPEPRLTSATRGADRVPPRPRAEQEPEDEWGADPAFGATSASAALAGFNASQSRRFGAARAGLFVGGGVLSLALVGLVGVWGYKVVLREVLGVPVVTAESGPMRVEPENPGGIITADAGLAVNAVAGDATAAAPSDVLTLAPPTSDLTDEDLEVAQTDAEAGEVRPEPSAPVEAAAAAIAAAVPVVEAAVGATVLPSADAPMTPEQVQAFADRIAAGVAPLAPLVPLAGATPTPVQAPASAPADAAPEVERLAADVPGVAVALRPPVRPASRVSDVTLTSAPAAEEEAAEGEAVALTGSIPAGTALVQLGAFDSPEVAAAEWERLQDPFGDFLGTRERVIQEAVSGGRTFYRLRALGFEDLADARRLCAALVAEEAGCIPVVVQ